MSTETPAMPRRRRRVRKDSPIAENIVHTWVGEVQFNRGLKYLEQQLVFAHSRNGPYVGAWCAGKNGGSQKYQITTTIVDGRIEKALCTCSIGKHGVCPHIAAVLVEYSRNPELYKEITLVTWVKNLLGLKK